MYHCLKEDKNNKHPYNKLLKFYFLRQKNQKILYQLNK